MYFNKSLILKKLQQTNAHFGKNISSKNSKWSRLNTQRIQSYIFGFRCSAGAPIINLDETIISLRRACNVVQKIIQSKGRLLFVNTNPRFNKIIQKTALYSDQSYINYKWVGGFLTNWNHMQNVQQQFQRFQKVLQNTFGDLRALGAKPSTTLVHLTNSNFKASFCESILLTEPRYKKMQKCFEGTLGSVQNYEIPDCIIVFNVNQNSNAIYEAYKNQIPIISLVDSNIPNKLYQYITYPIPANYESAQFVYLFCNCILKTITR